MADTSPSAFNSPGPQSAAARGKLASRAAMASVAMAATLLALKIWASISTGSVSVLGSLADTTLDIIASLVTLFSVRLAAEPADDEHGFGHGKAEAISALFQTWLIGLSALGIAWQAITRLGSGAAPNHPTLGIAVSAFAMAATLLLIWYQKNVVRQTGSVAIAADSAHYSSDLLLNAAVIAALVLDSLLGVRGADPLFGMAIAGWLVWHAWGVARHAIDQLMDHEWPEEKRQRFLEVAQSHPELRGIHDFRTRSSGTRDFVQFHVWVDPQMTVEEAHRVMDEVEEKLMAEFPHTEVIIHPDPDGHPAEERPA
ncbi:MAG: cation diffusion facilitator family transporter [Sphingomonadaceae bacterium]|nr:cation diffusion facilitator family transporter [Sphingomonadaceae bacterium]